MSTEIVGDAEVERLQQSCLEHMFRAFTEWSETNTKEPNAFYLTHAFAEMWFCFCAQLPKEVQQQLLEHWHNIAHKPSVVPRISDADETKRN